MILPALSISTGSDYYYTEHRGGKLDGAGQFDWKNILEDVLSFE